MRRYMALDHERKIDGTRDGTEIEGVERQSIRTISHHRNEACVAGAGNKSEETRYEVSVRRHHVTCVRSIY